MGQCFQILLCRKRNAIVDLPPQILPNNWWCKWLRSCPHFFQRYYSNIFVVKHFSQSRKTKALACHSSSESSYHSTIVWSWGEALFCESSLSFQLLVLKVSEEKTFHLVKNWTFHVTKHVVRNFKNEEFYIYFRAAYP